MEEHKEFVMFGKYTYTTKYLEREHGPTWKDQIMMEWTNKAREVVDDVPEVENGGEYYEEYPEDFPIDEDDDIEA